MNRAAIVGRLAAWVCCSATLLPLVRTGRGWVRIWDFPRVQIAAVGVAGVLALLRSGSPSRHDRALVAGASSAVAWQLWRIWPYTPIHPKQAIDSAPAPRDRRLRLLIANVYMYNRRADLTLEAIMTADADVVCLVETDEWWERQLRPLEEKYPHTSKCPLPNTYGMLFYSRLPVVSVETRYLVEDDIPSMRAVVRLDSGDEVLLHCLHPRPPLPGTASYGRDAELVLVGHEVAREDRPTIIMGDLNDVAWSYTTGLFQRTSHTLDPRVGRGMYSTFNANWRTIRYPLDHLFHTRHFTVVNIRRLPHIGSDHFPICVELTLNPSEGMSQPSPEMDESDRENAREILEDAVENGVLDEEKSVP